ncbi:cephalosporin-C deacetylase [Streptomyces sp. 2224.1]|uniref:acetylxylan esterase n=1 Tax=unclassified Streptomyces TaxID=2593676 RepID=UPI0008854F88|nr:MULTISPECIES: acetylxylan esterase [unclassified Streptomyces]PBC86381.1 cephalosporin-C deacetylase [Streptomyces sp. 2321.6]SDQ86490.1 cephalosporin-C deacetylase [Streptomyces sp. KS_16]SED92901.1 cephalosporin-C deacetylase [Streptomyces sp. 2224.1]SED96681.1 cephalosporin-C deacetylase [Streptomyces sp. 2133.1]SNC73263.1 cephalosporin-C deacetylase [Streptomyces sp. 2114.4]
MFTDLPLDELRSYRPPRPEPAGFDAFWQRTLDEARDRDLDARFTEVDAGLAQLHTHDVTFSGFGGHRIRGWFLFPRAAEGPLPCVVQYLGYGGGRGMVHDWLLWPSAGYATLVMDTRGQSGPNRPGDTPDPVGSGNPGVPGKMTQGLLNPEGYYYRRLFTDAVRAVETARGHAAVDAGRIVVAGGSQGGAAALATAGLVPGLAGALIDVPFLTHIRRAVDLTDCGPYGELTRYFAGARGHIDTALHTLDHFDGLNFAARATAPALFGTALRDEVVPPSTGFAAYHHYAGEKELKVWRFNAHEGGGGEQRAAEIAFVRRLFGG